MHRQSSRTMWAILSALLLISNVQGQVRVDPLVLTTQGLIKGLRIDDDYSIFLGIPYAKVDEGNPFGVAQPYPKSESIYEAYHDPPACPQMLNGSPHGDLDCLRLNIFVPNNATSENRIPVIVWIHGGAFNVGYTKQYYYGARNLVKHNVIVVTLNYRLGPYGFMCLDTPEVPGNQGLKDQLSAIRWVNNNIAAFGGDIDRITLMGESAGSGSVEAHLLSKSEKLFNNIILQSGTLLKPGNIMEPNTGVPIEIAEQLGIKTENVTEAMGILSTTDPKAVIAAATELNINLHVCIEKEFDNVEAILTEMPYSSDVPKVNGMNVLAGYTNREGLLMNSKNPNDYIDNPNYFRDTLEEVFKNDGNAKYMDLVRYFYLGDANTTTDVRSDMIDFKSDFFYNYPLQICLSELLNNGASNVYQYLFSYEGGLNYMKILLNISLEGAAHGDELGYLFDMNDGETVPTAQDQMVIDRMTMIWTNFAKYGNPIPFETNLLPVSWEPITETIVPCLNIDSELKVIWRPFHRRLTFWKLFFTANKQSLRNFE